MHKLLIADDEPSLRLLVAATLASEDYEIIEASDGGEALALARSERPKLALLDVQMPVMDGLEVCRRIKSDEDLRSTAVVMLTSAAQPSEREAGFAAGADEYLTKPFSPLQLLRVIEQLVS
ncbi:MAG TPA: response regulator [Chloroflexota bacterium]|nr:response regulator [Chloroflexota bacterium]